MDPNSGVVSDEISEAIGKWHRRRRNNIIEAAKMIVQQYENDHVLKNPCYTGARTGELWVRELIHAHEKRPIHSLRMPGQVFLELCSILVNKYNLPVQNKGLLVEERVAMFVMTLAHGWPCRETQENFQHSSETVHRHFYGVMRAMLPFARDMVKPKNDERQRKHYLKRQPNYAVFKDCVGAIDGTHIRCVPPENRVPWFGRKACYTQNVLAVYDFNMRFTFVSAGWEGSMHDTNVFNRVINEPAMHFPIPETGKYYLADAGYPCRVGFLGPYKGQRYHFQEFRGIESQMNVKEKFNHAHSSLHGIIERSFGVLKERFQILDKMPPVNIMVQAQIVSVAMALHNFIREIATKDAFFDDADMNEDYEYVDELDLHDTGPPEQCEEGDSIQMVQLRDQLASLLVRRAAHRNR